MVNENLVEIVGIIDRSGSMSTIQADAEGGFNTFIKEQKENIIDKKVKVTIAEFDDKYEIVCDGLDIKKFKKYTLIPRGSTALYDAIGRTIDAVGSRLSSSKDQDKPGRIIVVVVTDGQENASKEYSHARVSEMINHQKSKYSWEFLFMCTDELSQKEAASLGINPNCIAVYSSDELGLKGYSDLSRSVCFAVYTNSVADFTKFKPKEGAKKKNQNTKRIDSFLPIQNLEETKKTS